MKGLEAEGKFALSAQGRINFAAGLLSAKYTSYTTPNGQSFAGQSLDRAPKATVNLGYTHDIDFSDDSRLTLHLGTRYTDS